VLEGVLGTRGKIRCYGAWIVIEPNNPNIDVDALMDRVRAEVVRRQFGALGAPADERPREGSFNELDFESHVATAARFAEARARWPSRLRFFPFNLPWVQRTGLRAHAFLFRDQRNVNFELIHALRESEMMNRRLSERLTQLEGRIARLETGD